MQIKFNTKLAEIPKHKKLHKSKASKLKSTKYKKSLSSIKLAFLALVMIFSLLFLSKAVQFGNSLYKPLGEDVLSRKHYTWDKKSAIYVAFKTSTISVLNFDPNEKKAVVLQIPDDTFLELPKGFGSWKVGSIYKLGEEENPPIGSELIKESMKKLLGLPVDGFITLNNVTQTSLKEYLLSWNKNPLTFLSFIRSVKTDLTPLELLSLYQEVSSLRADKITELNLGESNITKSKLLGDSSRVLGVDYVSLDLFIRKNMFDSEVIQEGSSIAIFNGTAHPGLAQIASRLVTNLGGEVIIVSNSEKPFQTSAISYPKDSTAGTRLAQIFAPDCIKVCVLDDPKIDTSRADINIILGEDYYQQMSSRN